MKKKRTYDIVIKRKGKSREGGGGGGGSSGHYVKCISKDCTSYVVNSISMTYGGPSKKVLFFRIRIPAVLPQFNVKISLAYYRQNDTNKRSCSKAFRGQNTSP